MNKLINCEPIEVFKYFELLSSIPRGSGNEKAASEFVYNFALERGLFSVIDEAYNVIVKKNGQKGHENSPAVMLQGHIDMVCEKNRETEFNFLEDGLDLYVEGDYIKAKGTTLGADNGVAIAYMMALMDSDQIEHPPLEMIITTNEEVGMDGAIAISTQHLTSKILINIDTEDEGIFTSSCAGGLKISTIIPIEYDFLDEELEAYNLVVSKLKGGHSGTDIILEKGNSNVILGRVLLELNNKYDIFLTSINGGSKDNAIPREAEALLLIKQTDSDAVKSLVVDFEKVIKKELRAIDPDLSVCLEYSKTKTNKVFSPLTTDKIISALNLIPNGVINMSKDLIGIVETSNNIGVIKTQECNILENKPENKFLSDVVFITCAVRSSVISRKYHIVNQIETLAKLIGAKTTKRGDYPAWEFNPNSTIRNLFIETYMEMYDREPTILGIHAGLECGLFAKKIDGLDMISFGPDVRFAHTPDEALSVSSTKRCWEFLLEVLRKIN